MTNSKHKRLHTYMFSLFYPAVLGSFLFGLLTANIAGWVNWVIFAGMGIYFLTQYGERFLGAEKQYRWVDFGFGIAELVALIAVFASIGFFSAGICTEGCGVNESGFVESLISYLAENEESSKWIAMGVAFVIPPIDAFRKDGWKGFTDNARRTRAILSGFAILGSVLGFLGSNGGKCDSILIGIGLTIILVSLFTYILNMKAET